MKRVGKCKWEIPTDFKPGMRVPGLIFADEYVLDKAMADKAIEQVANVAMLPGIVKYAIAMPDIHWGYGFPVGGVAAFDVEDGVICPGGIGYDINCGVRLIATPISGEELRPRISELMDVLFEKVPAGVGSEGHIKLSVKESCAVLEQGARWAVEKGYGVPADLDRCEERGCLKGASAESVSSKAFKRGAQELGTLGSGNHFLEVGVVERVFSNQAASELGLFEGQVTVMIHSGSRGLGHQVCTDYLEIMEDAVKEYGIRIPDKQLACVPFKSKEGQSYYSAMAAAANYAWANREVLTHLVRECFKDVFPRVDYEELRLVYDIAHNIARIEEHVVDGKTLKLCVHRKGATRAFWSSKGAHPVLVPGDMGRSSWVLRGTRVAMEEAFGSCCHGAGRAASRASARKQVRGEAVKAQLLRQGIEVRSASLAGLAEEAPEAYKDVDRVVEICTQAGLCEKIARIKPAGVLKG